MTQSSMTVKIGLDILAYNNIDMFCCSEEQRSKDSYQIIKVNEKHQQEVTYVPDLMTASKQFTESKTSKVRPVKLSDYQQLYEKHTKDHSKFEDISFPPNQNSLGKVDVPNVHWKRIPQFLKNPTLFDQRIEPNDVIHKNVGDCYLLSAIAALAENPDLIKTIFHGQQFNEAGIYRVILSIDGLIHEVIVDDFIPLNERDAPIFCQPKVQEKTGQFWTLILEKAIAKVKGSYANIMEGTPSQIFKIVTACPAESIVFEQKDKERVWEQMKLESSFGNPLCATTVDNVAKNSGLIPMHTYTVISAVVLNVKDVDFGGMKSHKQQRVVKMRNPWSKQVNEGWKGRGGKQDRYYWDLVDKNQQYESLKKPTICGDYGIFYIPFDQFCKHFNQLHYCEVGENRVTVNERLYPNHSQGSFYQVNVLEDGIYTFEISQSSIAKQTPQQRKEEGGCRSSLILLANQQGKFFYKKGVMKLNQQHLILSDWLHKGQHLIWAKIDPTRITNYYPESATLSVHSNFMVQAIPVDYKKYSNVLKDAFLQDGLRNQKKMVENNGLMTLSYKLLFQQGGFGYIVFHNDPKSNKCFVVNYDQDQFSRAHLEVVEPREGKHPELKIKPGNDLLILCRARNQQAESWRFPPKMNVKMQAIS